MKYGLTVPLMVSGVHGDLGEAADRLANQLAESQQRDPRLLDFGIGSDATNDTVEVELTVDVGSPGDAVTLGLSCLRTAIHATGGHATGLEGADPGEHAATYEITDEEALSVRPLERLVV